ncbi:MAG: hypothetical protein JO122_17315 [Acetobacteraceae bacterium]|nr:hypothetical protein [Acetobacteraceae bacterium]
MKAADAQALLRFAVFGGFTSEPLPAVGQPEHNFPIFQRNCGFRHAPALGGAPKIKRNFVFAAIHRIAITGRLVAVSNAD